MPSVAQVGRVEALGALADAAVPEPVRQALAAKGYRILLEGSAIAAELWLRKDMPAQPKKETADVIYDRIVESTLVGVLRFPQASSDFRGQPVPAGFYTLRYALIPNDGNHLGVAPSRDFLLMIPAGSDPGPEKVLKFQELVALSRQASRTKHPAPLSMLEPEGATAPAVSKDDQDHYIFSAGIKLSSGDEMPFALVVKGTAQQ
ncbi:MAG TPA: hypothetical protein VE083_01580 [Terriglobales bacterium]|nr:hypothetical protein [Terriglobales bacterium]